MSKGNQKEIVIAAIKWWESKSPFGWTREKHMECPRVNIITDEELALAESVAKYLEVK